MPRRNTCTRGEVELEPYFEPRFDYALSDVAIYPRRHGLMATDMEDEAVALSSSNAIWWEIDEVGGAARARFRIEAGEVFWNVLRYDDDEVYPVEGYSSEDKLEAKIGRASCRERVWGWV